MSFQFLTHKFKIEHSVSLQILTRKLRINAMSLQILAHKSSTLVQLLTHIQNTNENPLILIHDIFML